MNFFQAIILGIVQALTEYLPVSSSAHIRIFGDLMLGSDPGAAFTAIIQIGTELAVILYFRHDIINILTHWFSCLFGKNGKDWKARMGRGDNYATLGWNIIVGSIPIIILGFTLQNVIETSLRNLWITVTVLLVFGILLWMVDAKARQNKTMNDMTYRDAFLFGLGQSMALIPGVSRSGGTITVGRALGYTREAAVRLELPDGHPRGVRLRFARSHQGREELQNRCDVPRLGADPRSHGHQLRTRLHRDHRIPEVRIELLL